MGRTLVPALARPPAAGGEQQAQGGSAARRLAPPGRSAVASASIGGSAHRFCHAHADQRLFGLHAVLLPGLYIVATPIGNLGRPVSPRAASTCWRAPIVIAVEDSRVTAKLLQPHWRRSGRCSPITIIMPIASAPAWSRGWRSEAIALVSDAGTPLISDPGYKAGARRARRRPCRRRPCPAPARRSRRSRSSGLPSDRFFFLGFLPRQGQGPRRHDRRGCRDKRATLIFYESGPRLAATLTALAAGLGDPSEAAVAREISKAYRTMRRRPRSTDAGRPLCRGTAEGRDRDRRGAARRGRPPPSSADEAEAMLDRGADPPVRPAKAASAKSPRRTGPRRAATFTPALRRPSRGPT